MGAVNNVVRTVRGYCEASSSTFCLVYHAAKGSCQRQNILVLHDSKHLIYFSQLQKTFANLLY